MALKVTAIFDIGKTNKKFHLFDSEGSVVLSEQIKIREITDEDGFPTEDLKALEKWVQEVLGAVVQNSKYHIEAINFSAYGASLVHLDENGKVVTPLYNYLKPIPAELIEEFYRKYGPELEIARLTGSNKSGMLNSGMQLYWLKHTRPEVFSRIRFALHLPQYLSYLFTQRPLSDYTSIGCHTLLWDYSTKDYHRWVKQEGIDRILAPIVDATETTEMEMDNNVVRIGPGIHDSSASLLPYVYGSDKPFVLVSTGTWSVTMNPFNDHVLTDHDVQDGCINYMQINGNPVRAARVMLGKEYEHQLDRLVEHFGVRVDELESVDFNPKWCLTAFKQNRVPLSFDNWKEAYHSLLVALVHVQIDNIKTTIGGSSIQTVYVDGGFAKNKVFMNALAHGLRGMDVFSAEATMGSSIGAWLTISGVEPGPDFLKKNYRLKKHLPFPLN